MNKDFLKLYSCCTLTKGIERSLVNDLQRGRYYLIPNSLFALFDENGVIDITIATGQIDNNSIGILNEYIDFLLTKELAFYCEEHELKLFPPMSLDWDYPSHISNCIIDDDNTGDVITSDLLSQLEELCCSHIQLRFYSLISFEKLERQLCLIKPSAIKSVEIIIKYSIDDDYISNIYRIVDENKKIRSLTIHSGISDELMQPGNFGFGIVVQTKCKVINHTNCGIINPEYFTINIETFTESQKFNTCLNRKIGIDVNGEIKNCPSIAKSYGNIKSTTLKDAIAKDGFKDTWHINKDQIKVCKDCEFRHMCTDCRVYLDNPEDIYSKPLKCGYNPYTMEWDDWLIDPKKKGAIDFYNLKDI